MSSPSIQQSVYETDQSLGQYLLLHYGKEEEILPYAFGPTNALNFPVRCVTECLEIDNLPLHSNALDIGCAVGRSTFELTKYCKRVVGIDYSSAFIAAAMKLQQEGKLEYLTTEEGSKKSIKTAFLPTGVFPERADFICRDALEFTSPMPYDVVVAANLLCRLANPRLFLEKLSSLVAPGGQLIITSPYSWLEEFTPQDQWLDRDLEYKKPLDSLIKILKKHFILRKAFDMPLLIREHLRKYQWIVAQASCWQRK